MVITDNPKKCEYEISEAGDGSITIHIRESINSFNAASLVKELKHLFSEVHRPSLTIDLDQAPYLDDYGVLALAELRERASNGKGSFNLINMNDKVKEILSILDFEALDIKASNAPTPLPGVFYRFGEAVLKVFSDAKYQISFVGSVFVSLLYICIHPRSLRTDDTVMSMQRTGVDALPIVALISFLLGLIIAFMSSIQLRQFGANIYVASLVSVAMTYELGPIMTGIIVAGRSGSSFASEIGTMKVSEEVDALFTMGFDPTKFLVIPKLISAVVVVPVLTLFSDVFAIIGGLVVGVFMLDLTPGAYLNQTFKALTPFDVFWGVMKSAVFCLYNSMDRLSEGFPGQGWG